MRRRNFIVIGSAAIVRPLPMYSSRNRRRDKTIELCDATSGALNRSFEARSGARLVSGVLARQHPDMSFWHGQHSGWGELCSEVVRLLEVHPVPKKPDTSGRLKANP
jgi:hypothetical protein